MNKKNLPIKLFEKRKEIDERRVEGGGSDKDPKWVLSTEELKIRADEFIATIHSKIEIFQKREKNREFIPAIISVELNKNALAKSHRSGIKQIFNANYKSNLIGFDGENNILVKIDNINDVKFIEKNIQSIKKNRIGLSAITQIEDFEPKILIDEKLPESLKVSIINYQDFEVNTAIKKTFEIFCQEKGLQFKETNYTPELVIYKINEIDETTIDSLKEFEGLESISSMPQYEVVLDFVEDESTLEVKLPDENIEYPIVGVLDSGIAINKYTKPWLIKEKFTSYPEDRINNSHGTFVSGVILYGDELEDRSISGLDGCKIFDATVMPDSSKENISEDELVENIREAIKENPEIKIWNH